MDNVILEQIAQRRMQRERDAKLRQTLQNSRDISTSTTDSKRQNRQIFSECSIIWVGSGKFLTIVPTDNLPLQLNSSTFFTPNSTDKAPNHSQGQPIHTTRIHDTCVAGSLHDLNHLLAQNNPKDPLNTDSFSYSTTIPDES